MFIALTKKQRLGSRKAIDKVLEKNSSQLEQYKSGKEKLFGFFVGQVMKESKGKANPEQVNKLLKDKLKE